MKWVFLKESTPVREKKALVDSSHKKKGVSFPSRLLREGSDADLRALRPHGHADVLSRVACPWARDAWVAALLPSVNLAAKHELAIN